MVPLSWQGRPTNLGRLYVSGCLAYLAVLVSASPVEYQDILDILAFFENVRRAGLCAPLASTNAYDNLLLRNNRR
eukprot:9319963-Pyramimonas_sp.AAC.1